MNSTDLSREFESDFKSVCGIAQLTRPYPHVTNYDMILKQIVSLAFIRHLFMVASYLLFLLMINSQVDEQLDS